MNIMIIAEEWSECTQSDNATGGNFTFIHYRSAVKALDNFNEIRPAAVAIDVQDFPRHWKVFAQYIKLHSPKALFVLLVTPESEDVAVISEEISAINDKIVLLRSDNPFKDLPSLFETHNSVSSVIAFYFYNPITKKLVSADVKSISIHTLVLSEDCCAINLPKHGSVLEHCTLRIDKKSFYPICTILRSDIKVELKMDWDGMAKKAEALCAIQAIPDRQISQ